MLPQFEPRPRPMFTPSLEGWRSRPIRCAPCAVRQCRMIGSARPARGRKRHVRHRLGARGHDRRAGVLSCGAIRRKWFTALMVVCTLVICYSRIYLGKHFPMDIVWGTLVGLGLATRPAGLPQAGTEPEQTIHPPG